MVSRIIPLRQLHRPCCSSEVHMLLVNGGDVRAGLEPVLLVLIVLSLLTRVGRIRSTALLATT